MATIQLPVVGELRWDIKLNQTLTDINSDVESRVKTVNGTAPDGNGNVTITVSGAAVTSVNTKTGAVVLNQDEILDGTTYKRYSQTEKTKLAAIASGATANSSDATLLNRANHTGTQSADTIIDGTTNKAFSAAEDAKLAGIAAGATVNDTDANLRDRSTHTGSQSADTIVDGTNNVVLTTTTKTKINGIQAGATANSSDAVLKARANHTGTQTASTISDLVEVIQDTLAGMWVNGANITSAYDDTLGTFTVSASGSGGGSTDPEIVRDTIAAALSGTGLITVTPNDAGDTIIVSTTATQNQTDAYLLARANHTGTQSADTIVDGSTNKVYSAGAQSKLQGIQGGATANSTDATLLNRANHTGTQTASTISDLSTAISAALTGGATSTLFGWSGSDIPGITKGNGVRGVWMARDTWERVNTAQWLYADTGHTAYVAANPTKAVDVGVAFIPHDSGVAYDTLLDLVINNGTVQVTTGGTMLPTDDVLYNLGRNLSLQGPAAGTVYARPWWEMNMSPTPESTITRSKFIAAWNRAIPRIRAGFEAQKVTSSRPNQVLKIVFCPISDGAAYSAFYPDNDKVDVIGLDMYASKWGTTIPTEAIMTPYIANYITNLTNFAISKSKPLALPEWGNWQQGTAGSSTSHGLGDGPSYISQVFDWVDAQKNHPTSPVEYLCYFNQTGGGVGITLADTPNSLAVLQARVNGTAGGIVPAAATLTETSTGTVDNKYVSPYTLKPLVDAKANLVSAINAQTGTTYTLVLADNGKIITTNNSGTITVSIPTNASVAFPIGTTIQLVNLGSGQVTVAAVTPGTTTLVGGAYKTATGHAAVLGFTKIATDTWVVYGDAVVS